MEFGERSTGEPKYREVMSETIAKLQTAVGEANAKVQILASNPSLEILASKIGSNYIASDDGSLTLWEAVHMLQDDLGLMNDKITEGQKQVEFVASNKQNHNLQATEVSNGLDNLAKSYRNSMSSIKKRLHNLGKKLEHSARTKNKTTSWDFGNMDMDAVYPSPPGTSTADELRGLLQQVHDLENKSAKHASVGTSSLGVTHGSHHCEVSRREFEVLKNESALLNAKLSSLAHEQGHGGQPDGGIQAAIVKLKNKVDSMHSRVTDETYALVMYNFGSEFQVRKFCKDNTVRTAGHFWDLFSILVKMDPQNLSGKDRADATHTTQGIKMTSHENKLLAAMHHDKLQCFYEMKGGRIASVEDGFGAVISFNRWVGNGLESVKDTLHTQLKNYVGSLTGILDPLGEGSTLAKLMLLEVREQFTAFTLFVDTFHQELVQICGFTSIKAFSLIGRCSHSIWSAMSQYKRSKIKPH